MGRHRSDPRGLGRYLLLGVLAVVAVTLVVVGVMSLRGALSSKKPPHTPTPTSQRGPQTHPAVQASSNVALIIKIIHLPCHAFVKNAATGNILLAENTPLHPGPYRYSQTPLQVKIDNPACVQVLIHGRSQRSPAHGPWIFPVDS